MPAQVIYVVGAVATVAVGLAFYQFVYEPHLAPRLEAWAENFLEGRRESRNRRPVPVRAYEHYVPNRRRHDHSRRSSHEMDGLLNRETNAWNTSPTRTHQDSSLRHRKVNSQSNSNPQFVPQLVPSSPPRVPVNRSQPSSPKSPTRRTSTSTANSFRLPTPVSSHPSSPNLDMNHPLESISAVPAPMADARSVSSHAASDVRSPTLSASDMVSVSPRMSSVGRSPFITALESPTFDHPVILSPPPELPRSEPALSDLEVLSVHTDSDSDDDISNMSGSVSSWESAGGSPRLH